MTNLFRNTAPRGKRTVESGKEVAKIWDDDRSICFAGRKLPFRVPDGDRNMEILREALNTFIVLLSHIRGKFFDLVWRTNCGQWGSLDLFASKSYLISINHVIIRLILDYFLIISLLPKIKHFSFIKSKFCHICLFWTSFMVKACVWFLACVVKMIIFQLKRN